MHPKDRAKAYLVHYLCTQIQPGDQLAKANLIEQVLAEHPGVGTGATELALGELIREGYLDEDYRYIKREA